MPRNIAARLIEKMADGKTLAIPGLSHPLAMSEDGGIGFLAVFDNGEEHVSDSLTVGQLIALIIKHNIQPLE